MKSLLKKERWKLKEVCEAQSPLEQRMRGCVIGFFFMQGCLEELKDYWSRKGERE